MASFADWLRSEFQSQFKDRPARISTNVTAMLQAACINSGIPEELSSVIEYHHGSGIAYPPELHDSIMAWEKGIGQEPLNVLLKFNNRLDSYVQKAASSEPLV